MDYPELAAQYARQYGLDPEIFVRQMMQESGFNPDAVSKKGAVGIAQVMPATARDPGYGVTPITDPSDPEESLRFGAEYMRAMLDRYDGDYRLALAAYNAGPRAVDKAGGIPPFPETQNYVSVILGGRMKPSSPGGMSMGSPGALPSEELMFGTSQNADSEDIMGSLMERYRPEDQGAQAEALAQFVAASSGGPGGVYNPQEKGIFALPEARSTLTAVERLRGMQ